MKKKIILLVAISTIVLIACGNNRNDVIQWRGDRQGTFHETGLLTSWPAGGPQLLWHFDGLGEGHASPVIANGMIFVNGMNENSRGVVFAFDFNGNLLNSQEYGPEWDRNFHGTRGTITPDGDNIFFISGTGTVYSFTQRSLTLNWSRNLVQEFGGVASTWGFSESPLIVGDKVIATPGGSVYNVIALNKYTGELVWSTPGMGDRPSYTSPILITDQQVPLIVQNTGRHIMGINANTGEMLWAHPWTNMHQMVADPPFYSGGKIFTTSGYGGGSVMLRLTNGGRAVEEVWSSSTVLESQKGGVIRVGNYLYGSGHRVSPYWQAVNFYTGEVMWAHNLREPNMGSTIYADGMLYLYTSNGVVKLVRPTPDEFDIVSQFNVTLGSQEHIGTPIIHNGVLYIRRGCTLMAYRIR